MAIPPQRCRSQPINGPAQIGIPRSYKKRSSTGRATGLYRWRAVLGARFQNRSARTSGSRVLGCRKAINRVVSPAWCAWKALAKPSAAFPLRISNPWARNTRGKSRRTRLWTGRLDRVGRRRRAGRANWVEALGIVPASDAPILI